MEGKQCGRRGVLVIGYHGEGEIYGYDTKWPSWVRVHLCDKHFEK